MSFGFNCGAMNLEMEDEENSLSDFASSYAGFSTPFAVFGETQNPTVRLVLTTGQECTFTLNSIPNQATLLSFGIDSIEANGEESMTFSQIQAMFSAG